MFLWCGWKLSDVVRKLSCMRKEKDLTKSAVWMEIYILFMVRQNLQIERRGSLTPVIWTSWLTGYLNIALLGKSIITQPPPPPNYLNTNTYYDQCRLPGILHEGAVN